MIPLRITDRLRRNLRRSWQPEPATVETRLGAWYASFLTGRPRPTAIVVNERTLLVVLLPIAPASTFLERARAAAVRRLWDVPAPHGAVFAEERAMDQFAVCRTRSRSVLGSMVNLAELARVHLDHQPGRDLDELGRFLCDTPMFALSTAWPLQEATLLLGAEPAPRASGPPNAT